MILRDLIARGEKVAKQIDTIDSDFDQIESPAKDELNKLQSILCQIAAKEHKLWEKVLDARMKAEE